MNILLMINGATKTPTTLENILKGSKVQPVEIEEILEEDDIEDLESYLVGLKAEHIYVLYSNSDSSIQSLNAIKESTIKIDAFFTCL